MLVLSVLSTGVITKAVHKSSEEEKKEEEVKKTLEQHDNIVTQYKELIREQVTCTLTNLYNTQATSHFQLNMWFVFNFCVLQVVYIS